MKTKVWNLILLHFLLFFYSLTGILSKLAAKQEMFSFEFLKFYIKEFAILFFYAIGWQQIIKRVPLTIAFINKSITVVWGMIWGIVLFDENITVKGVIGTVLIIAGMIVYVKSDEVKDG